MTEIDSSLDLEEEKKEAERNINTINSVLVPYTISEESMDEEEEMELLKQEEEEEDRVKQEVREALKDDVDINTPRVESKTDCSVGTSALDQPIVLDVKDLERGEQAEILGSEEDLGDLVRSDSPELLEMVEDDYITPAARDKHVEDDQSIKDAHQRDTSLDSVDDLLEGLSDEEIEKPPSIKTTVKPSLPSSTTPTSSPSTHLMSLITTTAPSFTSSTSSTGLSSRAPTQADNVVDSEEEAKTMDEWVTEFDSSASVDTNSEDDEDEEMNLSGLSEEQVKKKEDECRSSRDSRRRKVKAYYDKFFSEEHEDINNNNLF